MASEPGTAPPAEIDGLQSSPLSFKRRRISGKASAGPFSSMSNLFSSGKRIALPLGDANETSTLLDDGQRTPSSNVSRRVSRVISAGAGTARRKAGDLLSPGGSVSRGKGVLNWTPSPNRDPVDGSDGPPAIPAVLPEYSPPQYSTPLPTLPMLVLCLAMLGEFLSASTPAAFMYFMVESFFLKDGETPPEGLEASVASWTGLLASAFFLAQFFTSLLWASAATKHGRRAVLFASLLGNACTLTLFGASSSLGMAICARLGQGLFNGAVGVARSAVRDLTDPTNEARAYSMIGLSWGFGGIIGPIIGGLLEHPVKNWPQFFGGSTLFAQRPYLLPCLVSSLFTLTGSILSLFLSPDGGQRTGAIQLQTEKTEADVERNPSLSQIPAKLANRLSGYFTGSSTPTRQRSSFSLHRTDTMTSEAMTDAAPTSERNPLNIAKPASRRVSAAISQYGTSYGYDARSAANNKAWANRRMTDASASGFAQNHRHRNSISASTQYAPDYEQMEPPPDLSNLNFAQRLLLANEQTVFNISDLWVAAATAQRDDDQYSQMEWEGGSVFEEEEDEEGEDEEGDAFGFGSEAPSMSDLSEAGRLGDDLLSTGDATPTRHQRDGSPLPKRRLSPRLGVSMANSQGQRRVVSGDRRMSTASAARPAIFANTGLPSQAGNTYPYMEASAIASPAPISAAAPISTNLAPIPEGRAPPLSPAITATPINDPFQTAVTEKPRSPFEGLPMGLILQYFCLALHGTWCDQVFMSFLVTNVASGGLGLNASHYAELVACMAGANFFWQFKFYPNIGPPRGKLSHLAMFRLGLSLYIPVYLLFPSLRALLHERTNALVMIGMILLSSIRYLANTCSYTAVMVLTNAMTPPHLAPFANGLAQSSASAARFCGPVLGAAVWSWSVSSHRAWPFDYHYAFYVAGCLCAAGLIISFITIR